ncbi:ComEC/Rec2 family competence protein [Schlesneria paludicola]|uniref:ComEC/Rec2 family competence protein n=1 Tax=Schlesneria paludicola TaxID=360056 RepID=UPI00029AE93E|nr:MBL fold metallo-hydrolase [Schlesneria paludicola]
MNLFKFAVCVAFLTTSALVAHEKDGRLDIYYIDVEGGAATLIVTPSAESLLIDSGTFDTAGRDLGRIVDVIQNVAKLDHLDHALVTHWHSDHFGNHAPLAAKIKIHNFWDRGIPEMLEEDAKFAEHVEPYRAASQNRSKTVKAGDLLPFKSGPTALRAQVITASGEVIPNAGETNPFAAEHQPQPEDTSDNAKSVSLLLTFGRFKYLTCGDLTWNTEAKLMTPKNPLGKVDLIMATHHGLNVSNNPVMILAVDPRVCVTCNGPTKGAAATTIATLKRGKSLQAMYQLHRNIGLADSEQAPPENIANAATTANCKGVWIKASVAKDGNSYTVQVGPEGSPRTFETR